MEHSKIMAVDLAKSSFQIHIANKNGKVLQRLKKTRKSFLSFLVKSESSLIFMEACGSSNYWARKAMSLGHEVKLIAPQYVKPFVKRQKNDSADAEAIFEAGCRENMNFVPVKSVQQQDIQSLVRVRDLHVGQRTALSNQVRGLLHEYGISIVKGHKNLRESLAYITGSDAPEEDLTSMTVDLVRGLYERLKELDDLVSSYDHQIEQLTQSNEQCQRLQKVPGIGPLTAASLVAAVGNASEFKNSRQLSAWLGLVPRQCSTGGRTKLVGLSKQGNKHLRTLMIHGGRAVLINAGKKKDPRSQWAEKLKQKVGTNKAAVAFANKNARTVWAILTRQEEYDPFYINKMKSA